MSQQSDIDTIRRGYAAFAAGDMDTLRNDVFTPDALWVVPGNGYLLGHHGQRRVLGLTRRV